MGKSRTRRGKRLQSLEEFLDNIQASKFSFKNQFSLKERSNKNNNRSKRSMPPYTGTKSYAHLDVKCCNGGAESYFFILGDSLFDAGNNQYSSPYSYIPGYHLPYGKTYFPLHPTGRYSDGRLAPDFIASKLNLPFMPPILKPGANFTHGANFASAGAAATLNVTNALMTWLWSLCLSDDFWETGPTVQGVSSKLDERTWHRSEAKRRLGSAVYLISIGGNDYFRQSSSNSDDTIPEQQEYVDKVIETIFQDVQEIYNGGRKFMFQNVGPLGCVPMSKQMSDMSDEACVGLQITLAILHNNALVKKLRKLTSKNSWPGFVFSVFDYFTAVGDRIKDPTTYGFKFGDVACCGVGSYRGLECGSLTQSYELCFNPSEYVYFDGAHNTEAVYSQLADIMWSGGPEVLHLPLSYLFEHEVKIKAQAKPTVWGPYDYSEL
ncbi:GDSL esterase/lipase 1-like [Pistacia vera]|uniref:GDSL esterase/lipase 1-like n=1 Tax=Pistacia vera TaxID=55513 RepID=UPI0012637633|nr:GDSL esterase/lipase 1-like [Pistacia vera]